jgi:hypothetical protein
MRKSIPSAAVLSVAALLTLSAPASAEFLEIGKFDSAVKPGCPGTPCFAISRTTGYQARAGNAATPMAAPKSGRIVAWTIALGRPNSRQIDFFDSKLGGVSQAQISVLQRSSDRRKKTTHAVVAQGEATKLEPYFGRTATFALRRSIPVKKNQVIALTVPTWAPSLATGQASDVSWRASRTRAQCEDTQGQTAQLKIKDSAAYDCLYKTARLTYSVTLVATPPRR